MKLKRFENDINESSDAMYFIDKKPEMSEDNQKIEIIEKLSHHWNEKLKNDFLVPRSLYNYTLDELKKIEKFYLNENNEYCDFGCNYISKFIEEHPEYDKEEFFEFVVEHNLADRDMGELQDISQEEIERLSKEWKPVKEGKESDTIDISKVQPIWNPKLVESLHELKQQHSTNEAVEDIRIEDGEIVFDVKCETDVQSDTEYNGFKLRFNHLCSLPLSNNLEMTEEEIIVHARMIKEQCINEYLDEIKDKLFESPDNITTLDPDGKNITYSSYNNIKVAKPFAFTTSRDVKDKPNCKPENLGQLWIGNFGQSHSDNCPFLGGDYFYDDLFLGRLWFKTRETKGLYDLKILSTWANISKNTELLQYIVSEIEKEGYDLSDWSYDNGYTLINIGNDSLKITEKIPLKDLGITFLSEEEKTGANIFRKPMKKTTPLIYRQAIYGENKTYNFEEFLKNNNKK